MSKSEKRSGFFGFFSRKSSTSEKGAVMQESGPSQQKDASVLKNFSTKWFGFPEGKNQSTKVEPVQEENVETIDKTGDTTAEVEETGAAAVTDGAVEPQNTEEQVHKSFGHLLAKLGVPVAVAAAACVVICKLLNN